MRIAFDAKRAFQNNTGLGHYSRTLISSLAKGYPQHTFLLMAPKLTSLYQTDTMPNVQTITPQGISKTFRSLWRSNWVKKDLKRLRADIYHGLSHEIPVGIRHTDIASVVTMHDLIFERYPEQYKPVDVAIYRKKFRYACANADRIIAISEQTKRDLMDYYNTPENKISVCYQACNPAFSMLLEEEEKLRIKTKYSLPDTYFLYVGSIIERKNLLNICKAMHLLGKTNNIPLVVIGSEGGAYYQQVREYVRTHNLTDKVIFMTDNPVAMQDPDYNSAKDFPAIYQSALCMIYPSVFEGFGLPVLESLWSRVPVITSNISCLPETGGDAALYVDPYSKEGIAAAMQRVAADAALREAMVEKGVLHAQKFLPDVCASKVMQVYESLH